MTLRRRDACLQRTTAGFLRFGKSRDEPQMTIRGGGNPRLDMAFEPRFRMGPPPRSFAADAYDCIMVQGPAGPTGYKFVARCSRLMASSPRIPSKATGLLSIYHMWTDPGHARDAPATRLRPGLPWHAGEVCHPKMYRLEDLDAEAKAESEMKPYAIKRPRPG